MNCNIVKNQIGWKSDAIICVLVLCCILLSGCYSSNGVATGLLGEDLGVKAPGEVLIDVSEYDGAVRKHLEPAPVMSVDNDDVTSSPFSLGVSYNDKKGATDLFLVVKYYDPAHIRSVGVNIDGELHEFHGTKHNLTDYDTTHFNSSRAFVITESFLRKMAHGKKVIVQLRISHNVYSDGDFSKSCDWELAWTSTKKAKGACLAIREFIKDHLDVKEQTDGARQT